MSNFIHGHKESDQLSAISYQHIPSAIRPVLQQIGQLAQEHGASAYAVGGCVRDWWLGKGQTTDLDIALEGDAIAFAQVVAGHFQGQLMRTHQQFGTATVMIPLKAATVRVDVAMCRKETYAAPAAYPRVQPGTLRDDVFRRDFTINAIAVALNPRHWGRVVDPFGGRRDLRAKRLRILHRRSFADDPSRILRGVRFAARLGLRWERETLRACRDALAMGALGRLNTGRLRKELDAISREERPGACLNLLAWLLHPGGALKEEYR